MQESYRKDKLNSDMIKKLERNVADVSFLMFKYYLKHEHECFIRYKTRGAAERFISVKARIASVLNSFKNDPFYTHLVTLFTKEFSI